MHFPGGHKKKRGSAILYIMFLILSVSIIVILAAEIGMQTWRGENRYEDQINVQRAWEGICAKIDADTQGSGITVPATYNVSQNGVTGTVTVSDNSSNISNTNVATATLTVTADSRTYPESAVIPKKAHTPSVWDYLFYAYGAHDLSGGKNFSATGDIDVNGKINPGGGASTLTGNALATNSIGASITVSGTKTQNGTMPFSAPSVVAATYLASATSTYVSLTTNGWTFSTPSSGASYDLVYVTGDLHIQGTITGTGTFYVGGNFVLDNDVTLAPGAEVAFIIPSKPVNINHTCNGLFYCNNGNTTINVSPFTGAVVCNQVTNNSPGATITFDSTIKTDSSIGVRMHLPGLWP